MILLLGGTSEAVTIAHALAEWDTDVYLSMATTVSLRGELPPGIQVLKGELDVSALTELIRKQGIRLVIDATHPYAEAITANAWQACQQTSTPYLAFDRPSSVANAPDIHWAANHDRAASTACSFRRPILLTIGVRNLTPYVTTARQHGIKLVARVLDHQHSVETCLQAGLEEHAIVGANGPFSVAENTSLIARHQIGVLVTKDSGDVGGVDTKIIAARQCACQVVVVQRPPRPHPGHPSVAGLLKAVRERLTSDVPE